MSADDDRFDPRFDPAFQRGYSGPVPTAVPAPTRPLAESPPRPPAVQHRIVDAAPAPRGVVRDDEQHDDLDEPAARHPNPFLLALGAVAVLLVGGGLYLLSRLREMFANTQGADFDFVTIQALVAGTPIIIGLGLATGIGVLFVYAVRWGRPAASARSRR